MKKLIAIILSVVIVFSACAVAYAEPVDNIQGEISEYPVVVVAGYTSSALFVEETGESAWNIDFLALLTECFSSVSDVLMSVGGLAVGNCDKLAELVGKQLAEQCELVRCNADGSSKYPLRVYSTDAAKTNFKYLEENEDGSHIFEQECVDEIRKYTSDENIYFFQTDWRMGAEYCANMLHDYVDSVIADSGKEKVNIYAISHGGQVTATYLALFGDEYKVDNCIMSSPAIGGAGIAYDAFSGNIRIDEENLLRFIEHGMKWEMDLNWLVKAQQLGILDDLLNAAAPYFFDILGKWGSIWDFMPADKYDEAKARLLDPVENAGIIEKSDRFHYEILPTMGEKLQALVDGGMNISIIAGYGNGIVSGYPETSDGIITTNGQSGAVCAPWGTRFGDGYVQQNDCGGNYKLSPDRTVDASTAYLPDNTWFVENHYHGMIIRAPYTSELFMNLLMTDNLTSVYSDPAYPQFHDSLNASNGVWAHFDNNESSYLDSDAKALVIRNVCNEASVNITAVVCEGLDLKFKVDATKKLAPGESMEIPFTGEIPQVSGKTFDIKIYFLMDNITPANYRTQRFTVLNGERTYGYTGFENTDNTSDFFSFLARFGFKELVMMILDVLKYAFETAFMI